MTTRALPLLFLLLTSCTAQPPAPLDAGQTAKPDAGIQVWPDAGPPPWLFRMGTFNTHRFFDVVCDTGQCGAGAYEEQASQADFDRKADVLANGIRLMNLDAVALQEVETQACLDALQTRLADLYNVAVLGEIGTPASVDVAVLSRGRLLQVLRHRDVPLTRPDGSQTFFSREFLEVQLEVEGHRVFVFAAHFRSKANDDPGRRLAEARAAHAIVTARAAANPNALIVLGGDLNDVPSSAPMQALTVDGKLQRVAEELGTADATYSFSGTLQAIDHLLLAREAAGTYVAHSAWVMGPVLSGYAGSDHAALVAAFTLR